MITFNEDIKQFDFYTLHNQLSIGVLPNKQLVMLYLGKKLKHQPSLFFTLEGLDNASYVAEANDSNHTQLELFPLIYPAYGTPDLRTPAFQIDFGNGDKLSAFEYQSHKIYQGKKPIPGLPSAFAKESEVATIDIHLFDRILQVELTLTISAFEKYDVFTQHITVKNLSKNELYIENLMSINLDFQRNDFDVLTLNGAWARETQINRAPIQRGFQGIDSKRGTTGHGQNPFIALLDKNAADDCGNVYSLNLVYSGNFYAAAEVDMYEHTRLQMGLNPFNFKWNLSMGEAFEAPEVVLVYAEKGLNEMSQRYHQFYLDCLMNSNFAKKERPILINNWEATYFDFNREKLIELAKEAEKVGIELFVLDDGWFGKRNTDTSSLGDWLPNEEKLGGSLSSLIEEIRHLGLDFGLWLEPEMVSKNSELFRKHPDWIISNSKRMPHESRHQYVLDLSRNEIQEYIINSVSKLLSENNISYVKWDMNRYLTDLGTSGAETRTLGELSHRYVLGLYRILNELTERFPAVLFESCAGGGGRFDPGMLYYTPQIWTSDDTDAVERLAIQAGNSLIYPAAAMSCHVSAVPNHQVARFTSLKTRTLVAQQGNFGYELDLTSLSEAEKQTIKEQITDYKKKRAALQFGVQTKLQVADNQNETAWQKVSGSQVFVTHVYRYAKPNASAKRLKLKGLKADQQYHVDRKCFSGDELMNIGLLLPKPSSDYLATSWELLVVD